MESGRARVSTYSEGGGGNLDESEEEADDDGGYYESAEWKAKVAAALQRKLDKVDISGKEE